MGEVVAYEWTLERYADEINEQYDILLGAEETIRRAEATVDNAIFNIGRMLNEVKAILPHGEFIPWIEANCHFSRQHAGRLMLIERRREEFAEPPTGIRNALSELRRIDQMEHACSISTPMILPSESPRGKLHREITKLEGYIAKAEEEGFDKYMVMEDEYKVVSEVLVRLIIRLRRIRDTIDPTGSHIMEVKS
jgi:hypothetical protein